MAADSSSHAAVKPWGGVDRQTSHGRPGRRSRRGCVGHLGILSSTRCESAERRRLSSRLHAGGRSAISTTLQRPTARHPGRRNPYRPPLTLPGLRRGAAWYPSGRSRRSGCSTIEPPRPDRGPLDKQLQGVGRRQILERLQRGREALPQRVPQPLGGPGAFPDQCLGVTCARATTLIASARAVSPALERGRGGQIRHSGRMCRGQTPFGGRPCSVHDRATYGFLWERTWRWRWRKREAC